MKPPKYDLVLQDCDEALKLDAKYVKALNRRAAALEGLERYKEALRGKSKDSQLLTWSHFVVLRIDYTAAAILDKFQNDSAAQSVERVLKKISTAEAQEVLKVFVSGLTIHLLG